MLFQGKVYIAVQVVLETFSALLAYSDEREDGKLVCKMYVDTDGNNVVFIAFRWTTVRRNS